MKILFVYKYLTMGGVESVLSARLMGLPKFGVDARAWFLTEGPGREMFREAPDRFLVGSPADLVSYCERFRPHVLTSIDTEEIFPVVEQLPGAPRLVIECHSPYRENRVYLRWLERLSVTAFWVPSEHQAKLVSPRLGRLAPVRIVLNPVRSAFSGAPQPFPGRVPHPVMLWIGRLDGVKNWELLLEIAARVRPAHPQTEWWIVGQPDGHNSEGQFFKAAAKRRLLGALRWMETFPSERMPGLFDLVRDSGGAVVSTSRHESFGLAIAEAMARGCAVVVPKHGPFPEFIGDDVEGRLYRPGSAMDGAEKIVALLGDAENRQRLGQAARRRVLGRFSAETALPSLVEALNSAVEAG